MGLFSTLFGASVGVGVQLYSNAVRKLPWARGESILFPLSISRQRYANLFMLHRCRLISPQSRTCTLPSAASEDGWGPSTLRGSRRCSMSVQPLCSHVLSRTFEGC